MRTRGIHRGLDGIAVFVGIAACSNGTVTSKDPTMATSITQYGITWTFDQAYPTGQFVNGDYWVVGPVTIVSIDPPSTIVPAQENRAIHGSMLDPAVGPLQGYDSCMLGSEGRAWDASLNVARPNGNDLSASNPLVIDHAASLASAVSHATIEARRNVERIAVLTILEEVPPEGAFRPPFVGSGNKEVRYSSSQVNASLLPRLVMPAGVSEAIEDVAARFQMPWVEHMQDWQKEIFCPTENMHAYGRDIASDVSDGALMLLLDVDQEQKELLLIRMVQLGLDYYGMLLSPNGRVTWAADGGHMPGRVFPILLAGYILGDENIMDVMELSGQYAYEGGYYEGNLPPDYRHFGEIDQTFYVTQRDVDRTNGPTWDPDTRAPVAPYEVSDIGMAEWGITHASRPEADNRDWAATYRTTNAPAWHGYVLASRALGIVDLWNHPALFDYIDRWAASDGEVGLNDLQREMWATYRASY